jgi:hypothetical protein
LSHKTQQYLYRSIYGGFYNKYSSRGVFLNTGIAYRYTTHFGLFAGLGLGLGYLHVFHPEAIFEFDGTKYNQVRDWGIAKILVSADAYLGYCFSGRNNLSIFVRYKPYYFQFREGIPAMNLSLQLGCRFNLK